MTDERKGYGVVDLTTGERRFILLTPQQWNEANRSPEVEALLRYLFEGGGND